MSPIIVLAVIALVYLISLSYEPYKGSFIIKSLPVGGLAVLVLLSHPELAGVLVGAGLLFSAGGDIALALDRQRYFVQGLALFLVAHLFYIAALATSVQNLERWSLALLVLVYALLMGLWLYPSLGKLRGPVMVYMVVIAAMGAAAALRTPFSLTLFFGAVFFILSDSLIAIDKFRRPIPYAQYAIMTTYYLGQFLIASNYLYRPVLC